MDLTRLLEAALLGVVEGLTEFLPVSSTGHLLLLGHFLGFQSTGKTFEVLIQLGAILAILLVYSGKLIGVALRLPSDPSARRFVIGVLIAFLPAAVDRGGAAWLHQAGVVRDADGGLHRADPRRAGAALGRHAPPAARASGQDHGRSGARMVRRAARGRRLTTTP